MEPILELKDLHVTYETDEGCVRAVNGVSLALNAGETLGLVGETGAGKSTVALAILRLLSDPPARIVSGDICFQGESVLSKSEREMRRLRGASISMIFQDPMTALNPTMTVEEQIAEVVLLHNKLSHTEALRRSLEMLEMVGISAERGQEYPHQFSGGMKQRVLIAIALACSPALLLADEPTTALDVTIQAQVLELMSQLQKKLNTAMVFITHDLGVVAECADRVAVMYAGEIVEAGTLADIFDHAAHPYTRGLFASLPSLDDEQERLSPIPGSMPDPRHLPQGCSFCPRCPCAHERCLASPPPVVELAPGHLVQCFYAREQED